MALTLAEAAKLSNDVLLTGVVETIIKDSPVLQRLPFVETAENLRASSRLRVPPLERRPAPSKTCRWGRSLPYSRSPCRHRPVAPYRFPPRGWQAAAGRGRFHRRNVGEPVDEARRSCPTTPIAQLVSADRRGPACYSVDRVSDLVERVFDVVVLELLSQLRWQGDSVLNECDFVT